VWHTQARRSEEAEEEEALTLEQVAARMQHSGMTVQLAAGAGGSGKARGGRGGGRGGGGGGRSGGSGRGRGKGRGK
jgi:hypothetical protein